MNVILIRHAEAGERNPRRYPDDDARPLTGTGRRAQSTAARAMLSRGITFDYLITSPLLRALQTAEIIAEVYGLPNDIQVSDALGHGCSPTTVIRLLGKFPGSARVALVGHEPSLSRVAGAMVGGHMILELKKSGMIGVGFDGTARLGEGTLLYHLKPAHLKGLKAAS